MKHTVAIRSPFDPEQLPRAQRQAAGLDADSWRADLGGSARDWAAAILLEVRRAKRSLTFNALVLRLTGGKYTADAALGKAPEAGLWLACERRRLCWANLSDGAVWWALAPAPRCGPTPAETAAYDRLSKHAERLRIDDLDEIEAAWMRAEWPASDDQAEEIAAAEAAADELAATWENGETYWDPEESDDHDDGTGPREEPAASAPAARGEGGDAPPASTPAIETLSLFD